MGESNPNGAAAEEFLWALGVGEALPEWLKDLRKAERALGLNQGPRLPGAVYKREGYGPEHSWAPRPTLRLPGDSESCVAARSSPPGSDAQRSPSNLPASLPTHEHVEQRERQAQMADAHQHSCGQLPCERSSTGETSASAHCTEETPAFEQKPLPKAQNVPKLQVVLPRKFGLSIEAWLWKIDDEGYLSKYRDPIVAHVDSVEQLVDVYHEPGSLDAFFADVGVKKLGHKRLFEKWFKENCPC